MIKWILIAVGGAVGSLMRYAVQGWVQDWAGDGLERWTGRTFPIGTLAVNATACLAMGLLTGYFAGSQLIRQEYRIALTVGLLGGYSTFCTFGYETFQLVNDGEFGLALLNMFLSCGIGLATIWIGYRLAESWHGV